MPVPPQQHPHPEGMKTHCKTQEQTSQQYLPYFAATALKHKRRTLDNHNKPVTDFNKHKNDIEETTLSHLPPIPHLDQKRLYYDKPNTTENHHTIPEYLLPEHNRPTHH
jgi:hypothetical protein